MKFKKWIKTVPKEITDDPIWKMQVYRYSLFLSDIAWNDISQLTKKRELVSLCDQLYRSTGSICANLEEGYSRKSRLDRARFFEYSLGSARESRGWYYRAKHSITKKSYKSRIALLSEIIRLLLSIIPKVRKSKINEPLARYTTNYPPKNQSNQSKI